MVLQKKNVLALLSKISARPVLCDAHVLQVSSATDLPAWGRQGPSTWSGSTSSWDKRSNSTRTGCTRTSHPAFAWRWEELFEVEKSKSGFASSPSNAAGITSQWLFYLRFIFQSQMKLISINLLLRCRGFTKPMWKFGEFSTIFWYLINLYWIL